LHRDEIWLSLADDSYDKRLEEELRIIFGNNYADGMSYLLCGSRARNLWEL